MMMINRRSLLGAGTAMGLTALLPSAAYAGEEAVSLTPAAMRADLDLLRYAYEAVHPGLNRYLRPGAFAVQIEAAKGWASRPRSLKEMFVMIGRLTASVRCGHTFPNPVNQSRGVQSALFGGRDRLPLSFRWLEGRMIATGGRGGPIHVPIGTEILEVNEIPSRRLLAMMMPLARADGSNDPKRVAQLGIGPRERYSAFDTYRTVLTDAGGDRIRLRLRSVAGQESILDVPGASEVELAAGRAPGDATLGWRFEIDGGGIGRLRMPSWVTYNSQWNWQAFLDECVDRLISERARGLVLDLRANEGGSDCGWHLLERILAREVSLPRFERRVRYRELPTELNGPLDTWDDSFRNWGAAAKDQDADGFFRLERADADTDVLKPRGRRFTGAMTVLVDASCSSATFQFANAVRSTGVARLIGETTGGNRRGINGGAYFFVRLPGTGLEVDLPIIGYFPDRPQPDAGVVPHVAIAVTQADLAAGVDRQMEVALRQVA